MRFLVAALWSVLASLLASCGGGGGSGSPSEVSLRFLHASPDAPLFNVSIDGSLVISGLDFRNGTGFLLLTPRKYDITVDAQVPSGLQRVVDLQDQDLVKDTEYTVIALGLKADDSVEPLVLADPREEVAAGNFRLQFVHGAPETGPVSIYATAPGANLADTTPAATLNFREQSGRLLFPPSDYQFRVTPAGDPTTVLLDTGTEDFVTGEDFLIVVAPAPATGTGSAPVTLLVNDGINTQTIFDINTKALVRVMNLMPDGTLLQASADPVGDPPAITLTAAYAGGMPFPLNTDYQVLAPGDYVFSAADAATPGTPIWSVARTMLVNERLSIGSVGEAADKLPPALMTDDVRPVATIGKLRILNGAPSGNPVDVYVTTPGTDLAAVNAVLSSVPLGGVSAYLTVVPQDYIITFTTAGTKTVLTTATLQVPEGGANTLTLLDAAGGGTPLQTRVENDLPTL